MKKWFGEVRWSVDDVLEQAKADGIELTRKQALDFLKRNSKHIRDGMVETGWNIISSELNIASDLDSLGD